MYACQFDVAADKTALFLGQISSHAPSLPYLFLAAATAPPAQGTDSCGWFRRQRHGASPAPPAPNDRQGRHRGQADSTCSSAPASCAADLELIDATQQALDAGIAAAVPGNRIGDISHAIGGVARSARCGMPADFGGHGIGRRMHEDPHVPNRGRPRRGFPLRPGLTLAIEPMLMAGGRDEYRTGADDWTLHTTDGSRAAHIEHTVAITDAGPRVLTLP